MIFPFLNTFFAFILFVDIVDIYNKILASLCKLQSFGGGLLGCQPDPSAGILGLDHAVLMVGFGEAGRSGPKAVFVFALLALKQTQQKETIDRETPQV